MSSITSHQKRRPSADLDRQTVMKRNRYHLAKKQPETGLDQLPEEILLLILDELLRSLYRSCFSRDTCDYSKALHSLCLTNRKLNRLAKPRLYTIVNDEHYERIPHILSGLALDPQMADSVKYLSFIHNYAQYESRPRGTLSTNAKKEFFKKLGKLGIPELAGDLRRCLDDAMPEDYLATALVLVRNLEYLEVADAHFDSMSPLYRVTSPTWLELLSLSALSNPSGLCQHFQHLRHLRLSMEELDPNQLGSLMRLSALRTLHLEGAPHGETISESPWDDEIGKRCSNIETLIFEESFIDSRAMAWILDSIRNLRVLKLEFDPYALSENEGLFDSRFPEFSWSVLGRAIAAHHDSLERLYIIRAGRTSTWRSETHELDLNDTNQDYLACLRDLPNLRYLDTGLRPLRRNPTGKRLEAASFHNMLPASLEHLVIEVEDISDPFENNSLQTSLLELAANCESNLPLLRDVVVWLPNHREDLVALDFAACKAAFEQLFINIRVLLCNQERWQLHPSTVKAPSLLGSGDWGCRLLHVDRHPHLHIRGRIPVRFHGACSAYHDPYGWSIIDDFGEHRR